MSKKSSSVLKKPCGNWIVPKIRWGVIQGVPLKLKVLRNIYSMDIVINLNVPILKMSIQLTFTMILLSKISRKQKLHTLEKNKFLCFSVFDSSSASADTQYFGIARK